MQKEYQLYVLSTESPNEKKERQEKYKSIHKKRYTKDTEFRAKKNEELIEKYGTENSKERKERLL